MFRRLLPVAGPPAERVFGDSFDFTFPYVVFTSRCLRAGVWPSWNPFEFGGTPFWGNLQSLLFHPPTLLLSLAGASLTRFQIALVAQIALGAAGMFVWVRARTESTAAALLIGLSFIGSGGVINFASHYQQLTLYCLLPWPFAFYELWCRRGRIGWLFGAALMLSVWSTSSYPSQLGYYCITFVIFYMTKYKRAPAGALRWEALLGVAALTLGAAHWWPALRLVPLWSRGAAVSLERISALSGHWPQLFSLGFAALPTAPSDFAMPDITLRSVHVGWVALFGAFAALARPTRARVALAVLALACGDLMMERSLIMPLVYRLSPLSAHSLSPAVELGTLLCFFVLTLGGDGLADVLREGWPRRSPGRRGPTRSAEERPWEGGLACRSPGRRGPTRSAEERPWEGGLACRSVLIGAGGVVGLAALFFVFGRSSYRLPLTATLTPLAVWAALTLGAWVAGQFGERLRTLMVALLVLAALHGSLVSVERNRFILGIAMTGENFAAFEGVLRDGADHYVDLGQRWARRPSPPRIWHHNVIEGWRADGGYDASIPSLALAARADPVARAALLAPRPAFAFDIAMPDFGAVTVDVLAYSIHDASYRIDARVPALVVLNDLALPGWSLRVDGKPEPLLVADRYFRAVVVPAGEHRIDVAYRPPGMAGGLLVSAIGAALFLVAAAIALRRRR